MKDDRPNGLVDLPSQFFSREVSGVATRFASHENAPHALMFAFICSGGGIRV
jgi:hypothetical protein